MDKPTSRIFGVLLSLALVLSACTDDLAVKTASMQDGATTTNSSPSQPAPSPTTAPSTSSPTPTPEPLTLHPVTRVIDGDTLEVRMNDKTETIRLIGINTPETVDPRRPVECFGKEASDKAKALLTGKQVKIEQDSSQDTRDTFGRMLAYVYLPDGTLFNEVMVRDGFAYEYTYRVPYRYQSQFKAAEKDAQEKGWGLWAPDTCNGKTEIAAAPTSTSTPRPTAQATSTPRPVVQPTSTRRPSAPAPAPQGNCHPSYPDFCIPAAPPDLDCPDIGRKRFTVRPPDPHRFDADRDGIGCE